MSCRLKWRASHALHALGSVTPMVLFRIKKMKKSKKCVPMTQLWACAREYSLGIFKVGLSSLSAFF